MHLERYYKIFNLDRKEIVIILFAVSYLCMDTFDEIRRLQAYKTSRL